MSTISRPTSRPRPPSASSRCRMTTAPITISRSDCGPNCRPPRPVRKRPERCWKRVECPDMKILIRPLPDSFLDRVRQQRLDDLGQPVRRLTAKGGEPCRDILRRARPGEEIILASYCPFEAAGPFREF